MRKFIGFIFVALFVLWNPSLAQENADMILENMAKRLEEIGSGKGSIKSFSGDLVLSIEGEVGGKMERIKVGGRMIAADRGINLEISGKGGKISLVVGKEKAWLYLEPFKAYVTTDISGKGSSPKEKGALEAIKGLSNIEEFGKAMRMQILRAEAKKEKHEGNDAYRVTIVPVGDSGTVTLIILDKLWIPVSLRFSNEDSGGVFSLELKKLRINEKIPAGTFEFRPPAGSRAVSQEEMADLLFSMILGMIEQGKPEVWGK